MTECKDISNVIGTLGTHDKNSHCNLEESMFDGAVDNIHVPPVGVVESKTVTVCF